jgi:hypothetical protein
MNKPMMLATLRRRTVVNLRSLAALERDADQGG